MQDAMTSLSFGALRKAQRTLDRIDDESDSVDESDPSLSTDHESKPESEKKRVKEPNRAGATPARKNKHAPTEVTSKRPVSRRRTVVEVQKMDVRDPRFSQLSGGFDATKFRSHYNFLSDMRQGELKTLRENLKRARKLLASSPRDLRPEREAEVERLALAVKRGESSVNKDKREKVEQEALGAIAKEERDKRQEGKKAYWLKNAEKKKLLLKARYDAAAVEGGKRAVKKIVQRKRRKLSQKETKSRPFSRNTNSVAPQPSRKRIAPRTDDGPTKKRPKFA
ncbi:hypothetical protein EDB84DRAFT_374569 [Lactarius hengduanensis]|nr:hypothetical protein EDB84DRAFT_374569 [Lactarius hengduanensis]